MKLTFPCRYSGGYHLGQLLGEISGGFTKEEELKEVRHANTDTHLILVSATFNIQHLNTCFLEFLKKKRKRSYFWKLVNNALFTHTRITLFA